MIFSAIINITAALISVLIFFFTSNAPSTKPAFIFLYHFSIYKDEGREEFYFSFQKIFLKKSKNLIFRLFKLVFLQIEVVFLSESRRSYIKSRMTPFAGISNPCLENSGYSRFIVA